MRVERRPAHAAGPAEPQSKVIDLPESNAPPLSPSIVGANLSAMLSPTRRLIGSPAALLCLAILASDVSALAETKAVEIPFEISSNKPFVQVSVYGSKPLWFVLDTGCAETSS